MDVLEEVRSVPRTRCELVTKHRPRRVVRKIGNRTQTRNATGTFTYEYVQTNKQDPRIGQCLNSLFTYWTRDQRKMMA